VGSSSARTGSSGCRQPRRSSPARTGSPSPPRPQPGNSDSDNKVTWDLVAYGTIQSTDPGSDSPDIGDSSFILAQAPTTHEVVNLDNVKIGARLGTSYDSGRATPGLAPVPVTWRFQFSQKFQPSEVLRLVVWHQSYYDNTLLQTGYESWNLDSTATEILLPVTVLPVTH